MTISHKGQTELSLYSGGKSLTLPIATLFGNETAAPATLALQDLTQDGVAELIFLHEDGGTGALGTDVYIIERTTMTEYTLPDVAAALAPTISVTPTSIITSGDATYVWCNSIKYKMQHKAVRFFCNLRSQNFC